MLVAIQDAGAKKANGIYPSLERIGGVPEFLTDYRHSYALIGYAGEGKRGWTHQVQNAGGKGPSIIASKVPLSPA